MDATEVQAIVRTEIEDSTEFCEEEVGHRRAESIKYYRGDPLGNEEDGRSQVVVRVVREAVLDTLASLIDVFFGSERAVEFVPEGPEDVAMAEQATEYVNWIVLRDNPGVQIFHSAFKDSLFNLCGVIKYWRDEKIEVTYHSFTELTDAGLGGLQSEQGVEVLEVNSRFADPETAGALIGRGIQPPQLHDVEIRRTARDFRVRIADVPPEEVLIDRQAATIDGARYFGHRRMAPFHELVAMGYDPKVLEQHISHSDKFEDAHEVWTRYDRQGGYWRDDTKNDAERRVLYVESYLRIDIDDDGIAELRKFCSVGEGHEIINGDGFGEPVTERPFAAFCPDPEPHLFFGSDLAENTKDLQEIQTALLRGALDSMGGSLFPRTVVLEGEANIEDVLNTEQGSVVREYTQGAVRELVKPYIGNEALKIMRYVDEEKRRRVGTHNMALDSDALQSTTKTAVDAQRSDALLRKQLIARLYAEIGMTRLFKGILRLITKHQDRPRMIRLRNEFVEVDPREWNASMDVTVNVGLGHGLMEDRMNSLREVAAVQKEIIAQMGPNNPLVSLGQASATVTRMLELAGWKDTGQFINKLPADFQLPMPEPGPSDAELLAQVEREKAGVEAMEGAAKLELDRDKLLADILLRAEEIKAKYKTSVDVARIKASIETDRLQRGAQA